MPRGAADDAEERRAPPRGDRHRRGRERHLPRLRRRARAPRRTPRLPAGADAHATLGGNTPQSLLNHLCDEIAAGRLEVALVAGAEAWQTARACGAAGWSHRPSSTPPWGDARPGISEYEARHAWDSRSSPTPWRTTRSARRAGLSLAHRRELAEFAAWRTAIAAQNPYAWFRDGKDAATLGTVTPTNRMVGFPYPKFMNAILDVNQGAALLVASEAAARRLGIPAARWVYPWAGVDVTEHWFFQDRVDYHTLPGVRRAGAALLEAVDLAIDDVKHLDLYSCFPIAPRLSAAMLGIAPDDPGRRPSPAPCPGSAAPAATTRRTRSRR
jgi:acetyl-CoA C-acetyltransferase